MTRTHILPQLLDIAHRCAAAIQRKTPPQHHGDLLGSALLAVAWCLNRDEGEATDERFLHYVSVRARGACWDYLRSVDPAARGARSEARAAGLELPRLTPLQLTDERWETVPSETPTPDEVLDRAYRLRLMFAALTERERWVVEQSILFDRTVLSVAKEIGLTEARVFQIRKDALAKMKAVECPKNYRQSELK